MPNENGVTPANEWPTRRQAGVAVTLPSGARARLRRTLSLIPMLESGSLPNPLSQFVHDTYVDDGLGGQAMAKTIELKDLDDDGMKAIFDLVNKELVTIFISPKVALVPEGENPALWEPDDDNTITIEDLTIEDRMYAYNFAQGASASLARFPQPAQNVAAVANGGAVVNTSK